VTYGTCEPLFFHVLKSRSFSRPGFPRPPNHISAHLVRFPPRSGWCLIIWPFRVSFHWSSILCVSRCFLPFFAQLFSLRLHPTWFFFRIIPLFYKRTPPSQTQPFFSSFPRMSPMVPKYLVVGLVFRFTQFCSLFHPGYHSIIPLRASRYDTSFLSCC